MARHRFATEGLRALAALDGGRIDEAFKLHLRRAIEDCDDRPGEEKSRKVTLQVEVKPIARQDGATTDVEIVVQAKSSIPTHVSGAVSARVLHGGDAWFNDFSEDNPDQRTLDQQNEAAG